MRFISIAAPAIWAAIVFILHVIKIDMDPDRVPKIPHADKLVHFAMFGALSFLICRSVIYHIQVKPDTKLRIVIFLVCIGYGAALEKIQGIMPSARDSDLYDWFADIAGSAFGIMIALTGLISFVFRHHQVRKSS